ncbi:MAG: N-6 DNA methylase [bacterium]
MLDQATKRKIDSARNILVGKVPDPKAQVEQITTALVYKFMDDMDKESEELGGKARFFTNGFSQYSWTKLLDKKLSGQERLDLYVQAITNMSKNPHIPQLFRDIFKGAFLPFRDPRTLTLFLKEINEFSYDHSENLGNAFEYLLSILGSQGDAGQFRTPRHIIDFIAEVVNPKKNETILDPACGTAGFLISAYKYILKAHDGLDNKTGKPTNKEKNLTPDEKTKLMNNIVGYDISPDMVKLSLVNMYLHGFQNPHIHEYDSLTSEKRWGETFDVIMANPPFMTPKGGIRPHKNFSIQANRAEVLFVDYIMEHLNINGRAGIIVPEGVIFKLDKAYKALRKKLVEDGLFAVVSMPAGIFNPYAGVKTSILFFDSQITKKTDEILFIKVLNDGYDLGAQRRPRPDLSNDLFDKGGALDVLRAQVIAIQTGNKNILVNDKSLFAWIVKKKAIAESGDYNLTGEKYRKSEIYKNKKWEMVELGEVLEYEQPTKYIVESVNYYNSFKTPVLTAGKTFILGYTNEKEGIMPANKLPVIIFDDFTTAIKFVDFPFKVKSSAMKILHTDITKADPRYLFEVMKTIKFRHDDHKRYWISEFSKIKIPLPPLEVQKEIVEQIEVKQNAINHAKEIIKNLERERRYFGQELRKLEGVEIVELGKACEMFNGKAHESAICRNGKYKVINSKFISSGGKTVKFSNKALTPLYKDDVVMVMSDVPNGKAIAKCFYVDANEQYTLNQRIGVFRSKNKNYLMQKFLYLQLNRNKQLLDFDNGQSQTNLRKNEILSIKFYIPLLEIQKQLVAEVEKEEEIISVNKKLIDIFEEKIKRKIGEVWG